MNGGAARVHLLLRQSGRRLDPALGLGSKHRCLGDTWELCSSRGRRRPRLTQDVVEVPCHLADLGGVLLEDMGHRTQHVGHRVHRLAQGRVLLLKVRKHTNHVLDLAGVRGRGQLEGLPDGARHVEGRLDRTRPLQLEGIKELLLALCTREITRLLRKVKEAGLSGEEGARTRV